MPKRVPHLSGVKGLPGVPKLLAGSVGHGIERFVVALLTPNLMSVGNGLERYLQARTCPGR